MTVIGRVIEVKGKKATVEIEGEKREISLQLVNASKGEFVSCSLDLAIEKLDPLEAKTIISARNELLERK